MPAPVPGTERSGAPGWYTANVAVAPTMGWASHEGCRLRWMRWGDAASPPLVLLHGGGAHGGWWRGLAPFLAQDWCVIAPDLSGMGDSDWRPSYRTETWAEEVLAVFSAAVPDARTAPVLVGHSLGASVAAIAAARHGDAFAGVVLCDLGVRGDGARRRSARHFVNRFTYPTREEAIERFRLIPRQPCDNEWFVRSLAEASVRPVGRGGPGDPSRPAPEDTVAWTWKFDWRLFGRTSDRPLVDDLASIRVAVACIHGARSRLVTPESAQRLADSLGQPAPTVWLPDAGHHLMADQPLAFVRALRALLAAHIAPRGAGRDGG